MLSKLKYRVIIIVLLQVLAQIKSIKSWQTFSMIYWWLQLLSKGIITLSIFCQCWLKHFLAQKCSNISDNLNSFSILITIFLIKILNHLLEFVILLSKSISNHFFQRFEVIHDYSLILVIFIWYFIQQSHDSLFIKFKERWDIDNWYWSILIFLICISRPICIYTRILFKIK